ELRDEQVGPAIFLHRRQQIVIGRLEDRQHNLTNDALQSPFGFYQSSLERFVMKSNIRSERMKLHACRFDCSPIIFARRNYRLVTACFEAKSESEVRVQVAQRAVGGENNAVADASSLLNVIPLIQERPLFFPRWVGPV